MTTQELVGTIKKNPISVGCAVVGCAMIALIFFRGELIPEAETALTQKSTEGEKIRANIQYSTQLKEQFESLTAANKEIESRLVRASQLSTNTQYFYKIESETGVKILDLRQTTPSTVAKPAKGSFIPVVFSVSVQGELKQVLEFLRQIENGVHYARVLQATCSGNTSNRAAPLVLALNLELLGTP
jgi:hypothetical protein